MPKAKAVVVVTDGRTLFRTNCGGCHTLGPAGTHGHVGPVLSYDGLTTGAVEYMVENGGDVMPGFGGALKPAQIKSLAAYVAKASNE